MSSKDDPNPDQQPSETVVEDVENKNDKETDRPKEYGGPRGLEPTRYGDWERKGRCIDF